MNYRGQQLIFMPVLLLASLVFAEETGPAQAERTAEAKLPQLEVGIGMGLLTRPDYRGSREYTATVLPLPYVAYRSETLEISRDGLIARLFETDRVQLRLSASASLPGDESQETVRRGMPELLPTFEAGPSMDFRLGEAAGGTWDLRLPVRAVAATDLSEFETLDLLANPNLRYGRHWQAARWAFESSASAGPIFASKKYHQYFYGVETRFATPERPAYEASSGYSGTRASAFLGARRGPWIVGFGISHDRLSGAEFEDSPLVESDHSTVFGFGIFYALWAWDKFPPQRGSD